MRKFTILLPLLMVCCNPYQPYFFTHYNILADLDPASGEMEVNLQMVFVPRSDHSDSIVFRLNDAFAITALSAQDLVKYKDIEGDMLVLYLQDHVAPGDQLHISMHYEGSIPTGLYTSRGNMVIDSTLNWFPDHDEITPMTYRIRIDLPEGYYVEETSNQKTTARTFVLEESQPVSSITLGIGKIRN